jgi:hypothetical protein
MHQRKNYQLPRNYLIIYKVPHFRLQIHLIRLARQKLDLFKDFSSSKLIRII